MLNRVNTLSTFIGSGNVFDGNLNAKDGDVLVGGTVNGEVRIESAPKSKNPLTRIFNRRRNMVHVLVKGVVQGPIYADVVIIDGKVNGDVHCTDLEVGPKGQLDGDTYYSGNLKTAPGSRLSGRMIPTKTVDPTPEPVTETGGVHVVGP